MEDLIVRITTLLCIALSLLLTPHASLHVNAQAHHDLHPSLTSLPRKLKVMEEATKTGKGIESQMKTKETITGGLQNKEVNTKKLRGETWREWEEGGSDPSDLSTMDYMRVRRRRPIHNKSLPVGP